jgi:hypothetical protein
MTGTPRGEGAQDGNEKNSSRPAAPHPLAWHEPLPTPDSRLARGYVRRERVHRGNCLPFRFIDALSRNVSSGPVAAS